MNKPWLKELKRGAMEDVTATLSTELANYNYPDFKWLLVSRVGPEDKNAIELLVMGDHYTEEFEELMPHRIEHCMVADDLIVTLEHNMASHPTFVWVLLHKQPVDAEVEFLVQGGPSNGRRKRRSTG